MKGSLPQKPSYNSGLEVRQKRARKDRFTNSVGVVLVVGNARDSVLSGQSRRRREAGSRSSL